MEEGGGEKKLPRASKQRKNEGLILRVKAPYFKKWKELVE
jgi:hypothetical protein